MQKADGMGLIAFITPDTLKAQKQTEFSACVHKVRHMSGFAFVMLRTGRYVFQSIYVSDICRSSLDGVKEGCYVSIKGTVKNDERAAYGVEITLTDIAILVSPSYDYPLHVSNKKIGCPIETNLEYRSVALRNPMERAVFKVAESVCGAFREFMIRHDFTEIHTPKIVSAGAEGGANIFKLKYFGEDAFLAQSPQFYKQTCVAFFDRVFEIAPVYRAEKHNSTRHLNEYIGLDFEMAYIRDMTDVMNMETAMLRYMMDYLPKYCAHELNMLEAVLPDVEQIPILTFFETLDILGKSHMQSDLDPANEIDICAYAKEKYGSDFVFITKFPGAKRPFYAMDSKEDPKLAESFDLLFRGLEITTGGQRIHDYGEQLAKMQRYHMEPDDLRSYLDIHKYGMPPHGGLGIGLERLVMKLLGLSNIRQASLFPRDISHLEP